MNETHVLTRWKLGATPRIPIDEVRLRSINESLTLQWKVLGLEEKLELVVANFVEFEEDLLMFSHRYLTRRDLEWGRMSSDRLQLNRRIANLLSSCRLLTDQAGHELAHAPFSPEAHAQFKAALSAQYDRSLGYRVMEALRNHIQHHSIPITGISYPSQIDERQDRPALWSYSISLTLDLEQLEKSQFKRRTLKEIQGVPERQRDLVLWVRDYVEGLGKAFEQLRTILGADVHHADVVVQAALEEWRAVSGDTTGLDVVTFDEQDRPVDRIHVSQNTQKRRDELALANRVFQGLARRYVTSARPTAAYQSLGDPTYS